MSLQEEDKVLIKNLLESMKDISPNIDAEIDTKDVDEYYPGAARLLLSGWSNGSGYSEITVSREYHYTASPGTDYGDFNGFDVEFIEGEACGYDPEYDADPEKVRKRWLEEYTAEFKKIFKKLLKIYDFSFSINEP